VLFYLLRQNLSTLHRLLPGLSGREYCPSVAVDRMLIYATRLVFRPVAC